MLLFVHTAAILLSAALLFMVQPMAARLVLPRLGGSPAVWNTCMLFFQAVLLLGYGYSHLLTRRGKLAGQVAIHAVVLAAGLIALPIGIRAGWTAPGPEQSASLWLLSLLALSVGLPFFVVSTTGPLVQRWFASTDHKDAHDPYFLYAASNIGSLAALLAYPFLLEPWLRLSTPNASLFPPRLLPLSQTTLWAGGYILFAALAVAAGVTAIRRARAAHTRAGAADSRPADITTALRLRWIALAFVPSSLMLGVTQYLSTDIASIPLLWIVPLTIYLITFIAAFSRRGAGLVTPSRAALGVLAIAIAATFRMTDKAPLWALLALHPALLLAAGLAWHGRLSQLRPAASRLTEYYFWIALGGVLGGLFNALLAPAIFKAVYEYPIVVSISCLLAVWPVAMLWKPRQAGKLARIMDIAAPLMLAAAMVAGDWWLARQPEADQTLKAVIQVWAPALVALFFMFRPLRGALAVGVIFAVALARPGVAEPVLHASRTFFGVYRITQIPASPVVVGDGDGNRQTIEVPARRLFQHGTTTHGTQFIDPALARVPTSYYHRSGPIGQVFQAYDGSPRLQDVAVIGLGAGTLAAYAAPGSAMKFYEIDPEVIRIATTPALFSFIDDAKAGPGARIDCVAGDGRLRIAAEADGRFGLIVLDAFSSDAIPVHLITREAMQIYLQKLAPGGVIAIHISNYYLDLRPVLEAIALDLNLSGLVGDDPNITSIQQVIDDKRVSTWVVLARQRSDLAPLIGGASWKTLSGHDAEELAPFLWTDDYSNILRIMSPH